MAFYNEFFIEKDNKLIHIGSCTGSDTPCYFDKVTSMDEWNMQISKLIGENVFSIHNNDKHPFPWKSYKTSDNLIVLRKTDKKWFEFWKPTHQAWVSVDKSEIKDETKSYFTTADKWVGDGDYDKKDLIILEFPLIPKK